MPPVNCAHASRSVTTYAALVNITYKDHENNWFTHTEELGVFGTTTKLGSESGQVIHVMTRENKTDGCTDIVNAPQSKKWIALIKRGNCEFKDKISMAAKGHNASAVVIYDSKTEENSNKKGGGGKM